MAKVLIIQETLPRGPVLEIQKLVERLQHAEGLLQDLKFSAQNLSIHQFNVTSFRGINFAHPRLPGDSFCCTIIEDGSPEDSPEPSKATAERR